MTFFLVFLTTLAVTFWVILRTFRGKSATGGGAATIGSTLYSGFSNFFKPIMQKGWARPVLMVSAVLLLFYFWESISSGLASLFVQSAANESVGLKQKSVQRWLWVPGTLLGGWLLLRAFKPKKASTCAPAQSGNFISSFFDGLTVLVIVVVVGALVVFIGLFVLSIAGVPDSFKETFQGTKAPVADVQYQAPAAEPPVPVAPQLPTDIRVLCQDASRGCMYVPRSDKVQKAVMNRDVGGGRCVNFHAEPGRETPYTMDPEKATFTIPPNTDFWAFYLKPGEQFLGRRVCGE